MKNEITEIVVSEFKDSLPYEEQLKFTQKINEATKNFKGFISREAYFSEEKNKWVEIVKWEDAASAEQAMKDAETCPICLEVFPKLNNESMLFMHAKKVLDFRV